MPEPSRANDDGCVGEKRGIGRGEMDQMGVELLGEGGDGGLLPNKVGFGGRRTGVYAGFTWFRQPVGGGLREDEDGLDVFWQERQNGVQM